MEVMPEAHPNMHHSEAVQEREGLWGLCTTAQVCFTPRGTKEGHVIQTERHVIFRYLEL